MEDKDSWRKKSESNQPTFSLMNVGCWFAFISFLPPQHRQQSIQKCFDWLRQSKAPFLLHFSNSNKNDFYLSSWMEEERSLLPGRRPKPFHFSNSINFNGAERANEIVLLLNGLPRFRLVLHSLCFFFLRRINSNSFRWLLSAKQSSFPFFPLLNWNWWMVLLFSLFGGAIGAAAPITHTKERTTHSSHPTQRLQRQTIRNSSWIAVWLAAAMPFIPSFFSSISSFSKSWMEKKRKGMTGLRHLVDCAKNKSK